MKKAKHHKLSEMDLVPRGADLLSAHREGSFLALVWQDRHAGVCGLVCIGDLEDAPLFDDQTNAIPAFSRALAHLEREDPQLVVLDWRTNIVESTGLALVEQSLRRLLLRGCLPVIVVKDDPDPAVVTKLSSLCHREQSVHQAMKWLRLAHTPNSDKSFPKWAPIVAAVIGIATFLFFVALTVASLFYHSLPSGDRFPAVAVLALGGAVSSGLFGGYAAAKGQLPIPVAQSNKPVEIILFGFAAVLFILLVLGKILY